MDFWNNFWNVVGVFFWSFVLVSYLFALFAVVFDLFRDHKLNGWFKAIWIIFLIFVPILTVLVYLIARGRGMAERSAANAAADKHSADAYIKTVAGSSPAEDIAKAKGLLDAGTITQAEFDQLKAQALATKA